MLRLALRLCLFAFALVPSFLMVPPPGPERPARRRALARTARACQRGMRLFGLRVDGPLPRLARTPGLVVLNHLSWLDPILLFALAPTTFVTSTEIRDAPLLGWICTRAGCAFVERRRAAAVAGDRDHLVDLLRGEAVVIFPEATSSNGTAVLPFKPVAFAAAIQAAVPIQALAQAWIEVGGRPVYARTRDRVCWYGSMDFFPHFLRFMWSGGATLRLANAGSWPSAGANRKQLAIEIHNAVSQTYRRIARNEV